MASYVFSMVMTLCVWTRMSRHLAEPRNCYAYYHGMHFVLLLLWNVLAATGVGQGYWTYLYTSVLVWCVLLQ